ncbi:membrane hypothetical protein [Nocardioides sp. AX2bis]|nr:membrane hypothetical protein [Nocardioides sp. AX2bis]
MVGVAVGGDAVAEGAVCVAGPHAPTRLVVIARHGVVPFETWRPSALAGPPDDVDGCCIPLLIAFNSTVRFYRWTMTSEVVAALLAGVPFLIIAIIGTFRHRQEDIHPVGNLMIDRLMKQAELAEKLTPGSPARQAVDADLFAGVERLVRDLRWYSPVQIKLAGAINSFVRMTRIIFIGLLLVVGARLTAFREGDLARPVTIIAVMLLIAFVIVCVQSAVSRKAMFAPEARATGPDNQDLLTLIKASLESQSKPTEKSEPDQAAP